MVDPVLSRVRCERKVMYGISVDFVVELENDTEAGAGKGRMCRFGENVIG